MAAWRFGEFSKRLFGNLRLAGGNLLLDRRNQHVYRDRALAASENRVQVDFAEVGRLEHQTRERDEDACEGGQGAAGGAAEAGEGGRRRGSPRSSRDSFPARGLCGLQVPQLLVLMASRIRRRCASSFALARIIETDVQAILVSSFLSPLSESLNHLRAVS